MTTEATLNDLISEARDCANDSYNAAESLVNRARNVANSAALLSVGTLTFSMDSILDSLNHDKDPGVFTDQYVKPTTRPDAPSLATTYLPSIPTFPAAPDAVDTSGLFEHQLPVYDVGTFDDPAPDVDTDIDIPTAPVLTEEEAPDVDRGIDVRDAPVLSTPSFDKDGSDIALPDQAGDLSTQYQADVTNARPEIFDWADSQVDAWVSKFSPEYHTALARLETKINAGIDGGTALSDTIEQQIYDRARNRIDSERQRLESEATSGMGKRGFDMPQGAVSAMLFNSDIEAFKAIAGEARDVAIRRAEIEIDHAKFIMQLSAGMRESLRSAALGFAQVLLQINGQSMEYSRDIASIAMQVYQLLHDRSRLEISLLQIQFQAYETRLKSSMADMELYKMELDAALAVKDADLKDVQIWREKIAADDNKIQLYLGKLRGISEEAGLRKLSVDLYGEKVKAFLGQVSAKESEFRAFEAAMRGDESIVNAQVQKVSAYRTEVEAVGTKSQVESQHAQAVTAHNQALNDIFNTEMRGYLGDSDVEKARHGAAVESYKAGLIRYQADLESQLKHLDTKYNRARLELQAASESIGVRLREQVAQGELFQSRIQLQARTAMSGAETMSNIAANAVGAQNTWIGLANQTINS